MPSERFTPMDKNNNIDAEIALAILCGLSGERACKWNDQRKLEARIAALEEAGKEKETK